MSSSISHARRRHRHKKKPSKLLISLRKLFDDLEVFREKGEHGEDLISFSVRNLGWKLHHHSSETKEK